MAAHDVPSTALPTRLRAAGLLRGVEPAGYPARFETRAGEHHHHLRCRGCGRTEDVDCAIDATLRLDPARSAGYAVDDAEVVFWGLCPDCRSKSECAADN